MLKAATKANVIYEDDHLLVLWHPGQSSELLITFGDLVTLANGLRFFADTPAEKMSLNCIGYMAKSSNWYPAANMARSLPHVGLILENFSERILYGGSMGGYAALKYSRMFVGSHIIAFCPQWSIDISECEGVNPGWQNFFHPNMRGMGIHGDDIAGQAYVFYDPFEARDKFHAHQIKRFCLDVKLIPVPFVKHHVTPTMAGTDTLKALIRACKQNSTLDLYRLSKQRRRLSQYYLKYIVDKAVCRRPRAILRYLLNNRYFYKQSKVIKNYHLLTLSEVFAKEGNVKDSLVCIRLCQNFIESPIQQAVLSGLEARVRGNKVKFLSFHETVLVYDVRTESCCHVSLKAASEEHFFFPLIINFKGKQVILSIQTDAAEIGIGLSATSELTINSQTLFECTLASDGHFFIQHKGKFLSAQPNGTLVCNRHAAMNWEKFHFGCEA